MMQKNYIPQAYARIKVVEDLYAFLTTDFEPVANIVLFPRRLRGDFDALAEKMASSFNLQDQEIFIKYQERQTLVDFQETLDDQGLKQAMDIILQDMECLDSAGIKSHFRLLIGYSKDKTTHDFHVDGLLRDFDRYMTCYNNPVTEYIRNDDVLKVQGHKAYYKPESPVYTFRPGDFWKARVRNKRSNPILKFWRLVTREYQKRAFVHRAPRSDHPRIMVVGDKKIT